MSRLRAQNAHLSRMLSDEKAKTAKLRTDLISNLTNLVVGFTDAQDASWSDAIEGVQSANDNGIADMERFSMVTDTRFAESSSRNRKIQDDLVLAETSSNKQQAAGREVCCLNIRLSEKLIDRPWVRSEAVFEAS